VLPYPHHCHFPSRSPLFKLALLVAWKGWIMSHISLNMHSDHDRPDSPVPVYLYQSYETLLQQISAAIYTSLLFSITNPPDKGSLACCMKSIHYGSYPIGYACRSCQTWFSCSFVSIPMIWNTVAMNKCCHIYITPIFHHGAPYSS
jgi:hypothetical protein